MGNIYTQQGSAYVQIAGLSLAAYASLYGDLRPDQNGYTPSFLDEWVEIAPVPVGGGGGGGGFDTSKPTLLNTGPRIATVPYAGQFGAINSSNQLVLTTPNVSIVGYDINAQIIPKASGIYISDCYIHPSRVPGFGQNTAIVDCNNMPFGGNFVIEYCKGNPDDAAVCPWYDWMIGHDYTSRRNQSKWVADHYGVYNNTTGPTNNPRLYKDGPVNVTIEYNFWQANALFIHGSDTSDGATHNDGVQMQGGTGPIIRFNTMYNLLAGGVASDGTVMPKWSGWGAENDANNWNTTFDPPPGVARTTNTCKPPWQFVATSGLQVTCNVSTVTGALFEGNWIYAGGNGISLANGPFGSNYNVGTIKNNKFDHAQGLPSSHAATAENTYCIGVATGAAFVDGGGNIYEDTGHPASVR